MHGSRSRLREVPRSLVTRTTRKTLTQVGHKSHHKLLATRTTRKTLTEVRHSRIFKLAGNKKVNGKLKITAQIQSSH